MVYFVDNNIIDSFKFQEKTTAQTGNDSTKNVKIMIPLRNLSNICGTLQMQLISCESILCYLDLQFFLYHLMLL